MTATRSRKAAPRKGAAARKERRGKGHTIDFRGLELKLPAKLPGTIAWDFAEVESNEGGSRALLNFVRSLFGDEQAEAIRQKVADDNITLDKLEGVLVTLITDAFSAYGAEPGE